MFRVVCRVMERWTCERCGREFGRVNQSHMCAPAISLDDYFAKLPGFHREVFEAVNGILGQFEGLHVEAVGAGIMFKKQRTFAELRPRKKYAILSILLSRPVEHPRFSGTFHLSGNRTARTIRITTASEVDDQVAAWLAEAYESSPTV